MFYIKSSQKLPILATFAPNRGIKIKASAINQDLGNSFSKFIVEQKDPRFVYAIARAVTADVPNKNWDYFPLEEIKKSYQTFIGRNIFLDHNTSSVRNAVGKIIAAELREDEEGHTYVACLFKVDRQIHPDIAMKIENGIIDSVSMGSNVQEARCSVTGCNCRAHREAEFCEHLRNLGQYIDQYTGDRNYSINIGLDFTELSLVSVPADPTAKMHKVFNEHSNLTKTAEGPDTGIAESPNTPTQTASEDIKLSDEEDSKRYIVDIPEVMKNGRPDADVPNQTATVVEPVNKETGFYQIDAASTEAADLLYNIMEAHTNKGVEDIGLTGRTIKILFAPEVKDPAQFIADAVAVFGMAVGHGVVLPENVTASYNTYITKQAARKTNEANNLVLRPENANFTSPLLGEVSVKVRKAKGDLKVTINYDKELAKEDRDAIYNYLTSAYQKSGKIRNSSSKKFVVTTKFTYDPEEDRAGNAAANKVVEEIKADLSKDLSELKGHVAARKEFEAKMLSEQDKIDIFSAYQTGKGKNKDLSEILDEIYNTYSKESPEKGRRAVEYLASDEYIALPEEEKDAVYEYSRSKAEQGSSAQEEEKAQVADEVVETVAPVVEEIQEKLPAEEAKKVIKEVKKEVDAPVAEKAMDELAKGTPKVTVKQEIKELIDEKADADSNEIMQTVSELNATAEQKLAEAEAKAAEEKGKEGTSATEKEEKPQEEAETAQEQQDNKPSDPVAALLRDEFLHSDSQRASDPKRAITKDPQVGKYLLTLKEQGIEPGSEELDKELDDRLKELPEAQKIKIKSWAKTVYANHYKTLQEDLDKSLGENWQEKAEPAEQAEEAKQPEETSKPEEATEAPAAMTTVDEPAKEEPAKEEEGEENAPFFKEFFDNIEKYKKENKDQLPPAETTGSWLFDFLKNKANVENINAADSIISENAEQLKEAFAVPGQEAKTAEYYDQVLKGLKDAFVKDEAKKQDLKSDEPENNTAEETSNSDAKEESTTDGDSSPASFDAAGWHFDLEGDDSTEIERIKVPVQRTRRVKGKNGEPDRVETYTTVKYKYHSDDLVKLLRMYVNAYRQGAFSENEPPESDISLKYHATTENPVYGGSKEKPAEYTMLFTRKAGNTQFFYDVSGKDLKGLTGSASSMAGCLKQIFKAIYYSVNKAQVISNKYKGGTATIQFMYEPIGVDAAILTDPNKPMDPIQRKIELQVGDNKKEVGTYTLTKTMPNASFANVDQAEQQEGVPYIDASSKSAINKKAEADEEVEEAEIVEPAPEAETAQPEEQPAEKQEGEQVEKQEPAEEKNKTQTPVYRFELRSSYAQLPSIAPVDIPQSEIMTFLTSELRNKLLDWEMAVRKETNKYLEAKKKKEEEAKKETATSETMPSTDEAPEAPAEAKPAEEEVAGMPTLNAGFHFRGLTK